MSSQRVISIFISSTFLDTHAERDHLVTVVFPELRERLEPLGFFLHDIDLRWGVPELSGNTEKSNSWAYCRQCIDQKSDIFIGILGERCGYRPTTEELPVTERSLFSGQSITEMEIRHALGASNKWCLFYVRGTRVPPPPATPAEVYKRFSDPNDAASLDALRQHITDSG